MGSFCLPKAEAYNPTVLLASFWAKNYPFLVPIRKCPPQDVTGPVSLSEEGVSPDSLPCGPRSREQSGAQPGLAAPDSLLLTH